MDQTPGQRHELGAVAPTKLSSPHFDDIAVAVAQPVKPLPWHARLKLFGASRQPIAIVMAFGFVLLTVAAIAALLIARSEPATASEPTTRTVEAASPTDTSPQAETTAAAPQVEGAANSAVISSDTYPSRAHKRATRARSAGRAVPFLADDQDRPAARKVGEIRYGRSADRP